MLTVNITSKRCYTWNDLYTRAIDSACGSPELKAKDTARYNIAEIAKEKNIFIEKTEIPEEAIDAFLHEYGEVYFDECGNVVERRNTIS